MKALVRTKHTVTTPAVANDLIKKRLKALGMTFQEYVNSLIAYDCWAERPHILTGDACTGSKRDEERLWIEVVSDFGKPDKAGSFFEHRARDFVQKRVTPGEE